jgi:hypothetical protein
MFSWTYWLTILSRDVADADDDALALAVVEAAVMEDACAAGG